VKRHEPKGMRRYDVQVAQQIALLTELGVALKIPRKGPPFFREVDMCIKYHRITKNGFKTRKP